MRSRFGAAARGLMHQKVGPSARVALNTEALWIAGAALSTALLQSTHAKAP